ncbi:MAG: hypothetical protein KF884_00475 [Fimbriimonadaceae bacterium]|nr:hypothetical protein [Fimbriimonadaceae bacterium]QYK58570.1 MAG: hypothetical protein KF884_00475 [Fimbriimonadaceae bacterium]
MKRSLFIVVSAVAVASIVGCSGEEPEAFSPTVRPIRAENPKFAAEAGLEATVEGQPGDDVLKLASARNFGPRRDPFSLTGQELAFQKSQTTERLMTDMGTFSIFYQEPPPPPEETVAEEPLPAWRLAGVIIADGAAALLDMGGRVIDIRPGMRIPDTEWRVVSIDTEKAVLRRPANRRPSTFVVPLVGRLPGGGGGGEGAGAPGGGEQGARGGGGRLD